MYTIVFLQVTRTSGVRAKSIPSPYQEECIQGSFQVETSHTFADNGLIDFPQMEITGMSLNCNASIVFLASFLNLVT